MKYLLSIIIAFFFVSSNAQQLEKSLLWKISGKGAKTSYLYGTIHATCDSLLDKKVENALKETKQLYLELDMDDPGMQMAMMKDMNMKDGQTLDQLTTKEDYDMLSNFIQENVGVPLGMIKTIKPFFISAMFIPKILDCPMQSVEEHLMKIGKRYNEEVFGLETVEEQMHVFDDIPYKDQMDELVKSAKDNLANDKKEFQEMLAVYNTHDLNKMLEFSATAENKLTSKFESQLLTNRNQNWIPRIEKIIKTTPTFFGVGAAHLGGENGVIRLLRKQGYKVEAVF
ncbi:TraB/GumN family protein [Flavobacterium sp. 3HN19-14]|uniref:TraB/GumN family protein n=1 Tax=Flavobacterium sp. 3HN19-14 TaxID=3448133 RepID=UPI003EE0532E